MTGRILGAVPWVGKTNLRLGGWDGSGARPLQRAARANGGLHTPEGEATVPPGVDRDLLAPGRGDGAHPTVSGRGVRGVSGLVATGAGGAHGRARRRRRGA